MSTVSYAGQCEKFPFCRMNRSMAVGIALGTFALVAGVVRGEYADPVFYVTNPGGSSSNAISSCVFTKSVGGEVCDSSYSEFNAATSGTLVKTGTGWVTIEENHAGFAGDVHVEAGVLCNTKQNGLGSADSGKVVVHDGATLHVNTGMQTLAYGYKRQLYIEGNGVAGLDGSLYALNATIGESNLPHLSKVLLSGDSTYVIDTAGRIYGGYWQEFDILGHSLLVKGGPGRTRPRFQMYSYLQNSLDVPAKVYIDNIQLDLRASAGFANHGSTVNDLIITNRADLIMATTGGTRNFRLCLDDCRTVQLYGADDWGDTALTNFVYPTESIWQGQVVLNKNMYIRKWEEPNKCYGLVLKGNISGKGGISPYDSRSNNNSKKLVLHLGGANTFEGGVTLWDSSLFLHSTNALPLNGGALMMTNCVLGLSNAGEYALPDCVFDGENRILAVPNVNGRAKSIVKTGSGTLDSEVLLSADRLEVKGGVFRQGRFSWSCSAGLREYVKNYENYTVTKNNFNAAEPDVDYNGKHLELRAVKMQGAVWTESGVGNYKMFVYRGYIWNRSDSDVTWTFACAADDQGILMIDGETIVSNVKYYPKTGTVTLAPGPHSFEYRICNDSGYKGGLDYDLIKTFDDAAWGYEGKVAYPKVDGVLRPDLGSWHGDRGFMYKTGEPTYFDTDYSFLVDPGDASLFSTATNAIGLIEYAPHYGEAKFAAGTTFDLNGWSTPVENLVGLPTVTNGDMVVSSSWTIPAGDVVAGACLEASGKLVVGESASVQVGDVKALGTMDSKVIARAAGGIELPAALDGLVLDNRGRYQLRKTSATELSVVRVPAGIVINLR